jgi:hypothetical protein
MDAGIGAGFCRLGHGVEMRLIVVLGAIFSLSQAAVAQTVACPSIADPAARLACYDRAASPLPAAARPVAARPAAARASAPAIDSTGYVDPVGEEDAVVNAKMKNICRGC